MCVNTDALVSVCIFIISFQDNENDIENPFQIVVPAKDFCFAFVDLLVYGSSYVEWSSPLMDVDSDRCIAKIEDGNFKVCSKHVGEKFIP